MAGWARQEQRRRLSNRIRGQSSGHGKPFIYKKRWVLQWFPALVSSVSEHRNRSAE
jgi:hypothetical protein